MLFKNADDALMNAIYLSEKWAAEHLMEFKLEHPEAWNETREQQLADEVRHARMCLNALENDKAEIIHELRYSMQERLYRPFVNLKSAQNQQEFSVVQDVMERRATWVFKTYSRVGQNPVYKNVFDLILQDEMQHQKIAVQSGFRQSLTFKSLQGIDRLIFRKMMPQQFGHLMFNSNDLWKWYYRTDEKAS